MEKKIMRIGVLGTLRGGSYIDIFKKLDGAVVTCVCENNPRSLKNVEHLLDDSIKEMQQSSSAVICLRAV